MLIHSTVYIAVKSPRALVFWGTDFYPGPLRGAPVAGVALRTIVQVNG